MKRTNIRLKALLPILALLVLPITASADRYDHMMGDDDMPMMGGGMMGGGMMGGGMMGGGMMGGGMMGGGMMGGGMMGMGPINMLDLTDAQRSKIRDIQRQLRRSHFDAMEKMADHHDSLWKLYRADKRDPKAIGAVYGKIFSIKQKMIESTIEQGNRMEAVLTKDQREQLKAWRKNMGMGMGYRGRGYGDRDRMHGGMMDR